MFGRSGRDLALVAIFESIVLLGVLSSSVIASAASVDFPPTDFKVLSADGMVALGRAHFKLAAQSGGRALVEGKYQFTNGEYDVDEDCWSYNCMPIFRHCSATGMLFFMQTAH